MARYGQPQESSRGLGLSGTSRQFSNRGGGMSGPVQPAQPRASAVRPDMNAAMTALRQKTASPPSAPGGPMQAGAAMMGAGFGGIQPAQPGQFAGAIGGLMGAPAQPGPMQPPMGMPGMPGMAPPLVNITSGMPAGGQPPMVGIQPAAPAAPAGAAMANQMQQRDLLSQFLARFGGGRMFGSRMM